MLVPVERMARVVGAKPKDLLRMGLAMGLGRPPRITRNQQIRSYITVIRRNWHLLPYEQLLDLLGWDAERLAFTLREDDVLEIRVLLPEHALNRLGDVGPGVINGRYNRDGRQRLESAERRLVGAHAQRTRARADANGCRCCF